VQVKPSTSRTRQKDISDEAST